MAAGKPGPVIPERYIQALGGADAITSMRKAPKRMKKLIKGLSEKQLARRPAPGKWSIKESIAHLADGEVIIGSRLRFVAAQDRPPLQPYDQDAFVDRLGIDKCKTAELLEAFAMARALTVGLLARLEPQAFERIGIHGERGEESIDSMVRMYAGHDLIHEAKIGSLVQTAKEKKTGARRAERQASKASKKASKKERRAKSGKRALADASV